MSASPEAVVPLAEERFRCRDGTTVDVEVVATAAMHDGKPAIQVVARDISGRKRTEEALRAANRQLSLLNSITRHDILNKIMVMSGYLALAKSEQLDPKMKEVIEILESNTRSIREHIEFTRIYQNLSSAGPRWQDLTQILPRSSIPHEVALTADVDGVSVYADPILERSFSISWTIRCGMGKMQQRSGCPPVNPRTD